MSRLDIILDLNGRATKLTFQPSCVEDRVLATGIIGARQQSNSDNIVYPPDPHIAAQLAESIGNNLSWSSYAQNWFDTYKEQALARMQQSRLGDVELQISYSDKLRPYQRLGAYWLASVERGLLGDQMGLGKCVVGNTNICGMTGQFLISDLWNQTRNQTSPDIDNGQWGTLPLAIEIQTLLESGHFGYRYVERVYKQYINESLVRIYLQDGSIIESTQQHRYLTVLGWTPAHKLHPGVLVAVVAPINYTSEPELIAGRPSMSHQFFSQEMYWRSITQIEKFHYEGDVYDLEVPNTHNYIANTIVTHNTIQALTAAKIAGAQSALIVTPTYVRGHWARHINEWLNEEVAIAEGKESDRIATILKKPKFLVINHEMYRKTRMQESFEALTKRTWDVHIIDEAHRVHNRKAKQSQGAKRIKSNGLYLLTGTPIWNAPDDLWHLLHLINPKQFSNHWEFIQKFCLIEPSQYGIKVVGINTAMLSTLQEILATVMLRRSIDDVLPELPKAIFNIIRYKLDPAQKKLYNSLVRKLTLPIPGNEKYYTSVASTLTDLRRICNSPLLVGSSIASPKDTIILDLLSDVLDGNTRAVIFVWYKDYAQHLSELLTQNNIENVMVTGDTRYRDDVIQMFRQGSTPVIIGTIGSLGTGIDLTECQVGIFAEMDWVPPNNEQAVGRLRRYGITKPPLIYQIVAEKSIEDHILSVWQEKSEITNTTLAIEEIVKSMLANSPLV